MISMCLFGFAKLVSGNRCQQKIWQGIREYRSYFQILHAWGKYHKRIGDVLGGEWKWQTFCGALWQRVAELLGYRSCLRSPVTLCNSAPQMFTTFMHSRVRYLWCRKPACAVIYLFPLAKNTLTQEQVLCFLRANTRLSFLHRLYWLALLDCTRRGAACNGHLH